MKVVGASLFVARLPLVHGFETSSHRKSHLDHVLVKVTDEAGTVGWGEIASPSDPWFSAETVETAMLVSRKYLVPAILNREWSHPEELPRAWARVRGHEFAKAGFDIAAWDLYAKARCESLSTALGGSRGAVAAGVSIGIEETVDELVEEVGRHVSAGYSRVKLKIKPGWDVAPVEAVTSNFPDVLIHVDANGVYAPDQAGIDVMRRLAELGVALLEQPFGPRDFVAHAHLQRLTGTPVCLDESIVSIDDLATALALGSCLSVNIKVSRMGGLTQGVAAHNLAVNEGLLVWCGGMHEFGIGRAANIALSSLPGFEYPSDVSGSDKYYVRDVIDPPVAAVAGQVQVPAGHGLGHRVLEDRVRRATLSAEHFGMHMGSD